MKHYKTSHGSYSSAFSPLLVNNPNHSSFGENKLQPTSRHNPCPVCAKTNGNCRTIADGGVLCMTFPDGDGHPDHRYVKPSENGLWGVHYPRKDGDFDRQAWEKRKEERETRNQEIERQSREKCLSPEQRDRGYKAILDQLTLTDEDRSYLEGRGILPEVIARCRSVKKWQKLSHTAHVNLPGVNRYGSGLNNPADGILIAIPGIGGYLTNLRLNVPLDLNRKYSAISSANRGLKPNLEDGGTPFGIFFPENWTDFTHIGICEGPEYKAPSAAQRLNFPVVGFEGAAGMTTIKRYPARLKQIEDYVKEQLCKLTKNEYLKLSSVWQSTMMSFATFLTGQTTKDTQTEYSFPVQISAQFAFKILGVCLFPTMNGQKIGTIFTESKKLLKEWSTPSSFGTKEPTPTELSDTLPPSHSRKFSSPFRFCLIPDAGMEKNSSVMGFYTKTLKAIESQGYLVDVADWGQGHDKSVGDIDEISPEQIAAIQLVSPEEAFADVPGLQSTVAEFKDWVSKQVKRIKPQGFGAPVIAGELFTGDRVDALIKQLEKNRYVLDASWTGDGKSHAIVPLAKVLAHRLETLHPEQEIKIYLTSHSYRQPTVEALTAIQAMPTRHGDRYFPHGELEEAANCIRSRQFNQVAEKGYNPHQGGKHNPICHSCPAFNYCGTDPGMFRQQRRLALQHQIIRCHPSQIPAKGENQLTVVIWDEPAEEQPTKTINTNIGELDQEIAYHRRHSQLSDAQKDILDEMASLLERLMAGAPKLGLDTAEVLNQVKDLNQDLLGELITLLEQKERDLFDIFPAPTLATFKDNQDAFAGLTAKETAKLKGQFRRSNQYAVGEATKMTEEKLQELPSNGLIHLLRCLQGQASVQIQLFPQNLLLTIDRRQELAPIRNADYVVALDATNNGADFACLLNVEKDKVKVIKRKTEKPFQNLKVVQIVLPGWGSSRPSDRAMEKAIAVKDALFQAYGPMPVLTYKAQLETLLAAGQWYRDSRGSNQFEGQPQMLSCGLPLPNLGAIKAQFLATGGQPADFEEHYHRRSQREVLQNFGRQRANRYPRQQFTHFIITGDPQHNTIHDLGWVKEFGADYVCLHGFEITPHAGDRSQIARWHIVEAIRSGFTTGSAIAEKLGCSRRNVTDVLTNGGATLTKVTKTLLDTTELGSSSYKPPIRLGSHLEDLPPEILALLGIDLPEAIAEVVEIIQIVGWRSFAEDYLPTLPQRLRSTILATFWSFLDLVAPAPV
ncbi:hypothetical protein C7I86_18555 (plasmid) [Synechocystis sp. IPPAS B-1465]|nr:hypothetical protein C7I86_18555 [Synechocystis sp. IPPAS B-1465]